MSGRQAHRRITMVLSSLVVALGVVLIATTLVMGGGPLARGVFIGLVFVAIGLLRLWIAKGGVSL